MNREENRDILSQELSGEELTSVPYDDEAADDENYPLQEEYHNYELPEGTKKATINRSLIVATVILFAFVLSFGAYMLFFNQTPQKAIKNSGLVGTWLYRLGDSTTYYEFTEDGVLKVTSGTVHSVTGFSADLENKEVFHIYGTPEYTDGDQYSTLTYETYKDEDGVKSLKIYSDESKSDEMVMQSSEIPTDILKPAKDFKPDKAAVGDWVNDEYGLKLSLSEDGYICLDFSSVVYNGTYTVKDNKVEFSYTYSFDGEDVQTDYFNYEVKDGKFMFYTGEMEDGQGYTFTRAESTD